MTLLPDSARNAQEAQALIREHLRDADDFPWDVYDWQKDYDALEVELVSGPTNQELGLTLPPEPATITP